MMMAQRLPFNVGRGNDYAIIDDTVAYFYERSGEAAALEDEALVGTLALHQ